MQPRVARRAAEYLGPVVREILDVGWIEAMREGMADLRLLEAALVVRRSQGKKSGITAGELVNGWSSHGQ